jgi:hypothetical protein
LERITRLLDMNAIEALAPPAFFSVDGVKPVDGEPLEALRQATREHQRNWISTKDGKRVSSLPFASVGSYMAE